MGEPGVSEPGLVARLRAAGCVFAEDEAALLLEAAADGMERGGASGPAGAIDETLLETMVARRVEGMPLEHIVGWAEFAGLRIRVDDRVFVPRRRTEFLAFTARASARGEQPVVLDLCCGSGAIAAVVEAGIPEAEVYAADIDPAAAVSARRNLRHPERVFVGDLFESLPAPLRGRIDVIAANTPYVPTDELEFMPPEARLHERRDALDGGSDGLDLQRRIAAEAPEWLAPGGRLLVEVNEAQAEAAQAVFEAAGLRAQSVRSDDYEVTVVIGTLPAGLPPLSRAAAASS